MEVGLRFLSVLIGDVIDLSGTPALPASADPNFFDLTTTPPPASATFSTPVRFSPTAPTLTFDLTYKLPADLTLVPGLATEALRQAYPLTDPIAVVRVKDGDTIVVQKGDAALLGRDTLRFNGANTTECGKSGKDKTEKCLDGESGANNARELLRAFLKEHGDKVRLQVLGPDGYDRVVAILYVEEKDGTLVDVNRWLVEQGLAHVYTIFPEKTPVRESYLKAQAEAQKTHKGIWDPAQNSRIAQNMANGKVHITSFHPRKGSGTKSETKPETEYIRIAHLGTDLPVNLKGYSVKNGRTIFTFTENFFLPPGGLVQVFTWSKEANNTNDLTKPLRWSFAADGAQWVKTDRIALFNPDGKEVDAEATNAQAQGRMERSLRDGEDE